MKIAYVCADRGIPVFGQKGCSIHVQEVIRSFLKKGASVDLIASRFDGPVPDDFSKVNVHTIDKIGLQEDGFSKQVERLNVQIKDVLSRLGNLDFIYERYSLWGTGGMAYARNLGIHGVLEVNAPLILEEQTHRKLIDETLALRCEHRVFDDASLILGVSDEVCDYVRSKVVKDGSGRIVTIPNGINPNRFVEIEMLRRKYHDANSLTIGFVGSLKPWHGIENLIKVFSVLLRIYPQLKLLIVGDGPQREQISNEIQQLGIRDSVELTGAVMPEMVPVYLSRMDIAVAPYPAIEQFYFSPLKVYEYMAAGLPVVASRIGQLKGLIEEKVDGVFFDPRLESSLFESLKMLIENPELCAVIGQNAKSKILSRYTWDHVTDQIIEAISKIKINGVVAC